MKKMGIRTDILKKYLNGKFSLNDKVEVDEYLTDQKHNSEINEVLSEHWNQLETSGIKSTKNLNPLLDKINHKIVLHSPKSAGTLNLLWQFYAKAAAILLVPIILFSLYFHQSKNESSSNAWVEVHSPYGARTQFSLPDGTTGWLNSGSVIKYPSQFNTERNVSLNGEAYFDVVKNPKLPFVVKTKSIGIKVLGTSFNVVSYDIDSIAEVVVTTGKVEVTANESKMRQHLLPNERLVFNNQVNRAVKSVVDVQNYTSWKSGKLIFMNDNMDEVVRKISRYYNVDFNVCENVDKTQLFRAIMEEESLEEILRYMKLTMDIDYKVLERKRDADGILSRREIIIINSVKN